MERTFGPVLRQKERLKLPGVKLPDALKEIESARPIYLGYERAFWIDCLKLSEELIAHRSGGDPADEDVRKDHVFSLSQYFFGKYMLDFRDFLALLMFGVPEIDRRKRQGKRTKGKVK